MPINQRFFEGGDTFRGFKLAGIGPRDIDAPIDQGALGGNVFAIGTLAARLPTCCPKAMASRWALFTDFGTLGRVDNVIRACTPNTTTGQGTCDKDNLAFRATAGVSFGWRSPFGPIQIDLALPYIKAPYDRPQILHFSTATGF